MAGNVLIFVEPGSEGRVLANAARWLEPGGRLVAGYSLQPGGFGPAEHDRLAEAAGLSTRRPLVHLGPASLRANCELRRFRASQRVLRTGPLRATEPQQQIRACTECASKARFVRLRAMGTEELDPIDHQIIELLSQNARRTMADIGEQVSLSASAVTRRIERLERTGVIAGYTVVVDHRKAGRPIQAFTEVRFAGTADLNEIQETAMQLSEVQAVFTTAGDPDALVWLQVPDVERLGQVIEQLRRRGRVTGTKTLIVLDTWSRHRALEANGLAVH